MDWRVNRVTGIPLGRWCSSITIWPKNTFQLLAHRLCAAHDNELVFVSRTHKYTIENNIIPCLTCVGSLKVRNTEGADKHKQHALPCNQKVHNKPSWKLKFYLQKQSCTCTNCRFKHFKCFWLWTSIRPYRYNDSTTKTNLISKNNSPFFTLFQSCNLFF